MNYGYEGKEDKELIKRYNKDNDKIVINYLDGSQQEILLTDENEKKLLIEMLEQAKERNNIYNKENLTKAGNNNLYREIFCILMCSSNIISAIKTNILEKDILSMLSAMLAGGFMVLATIYGKEYKIQNTKLNEIKKYEIYLDLLSQLENLEEKDKNNLLKIENEYVDINTLDNYSLKKIKKLRDIINNNSIYIQMMSDKKVLSKRINN